MIKRGEYDVFGFGWMRMDKIKEETMAKVNQKQIDELFENLDARLDAKEDADMERRQPLLVDDIGALVLAGVDPRTITDHVIRKGPHRWVESQVVQSVARHLERGD